MGFAAFNLYFTVFLQIEAVCFDVPERFDTQCV